jgi:hypothetical protein
MSFRLLDLKIPLAAIKMDLNEDLTLIPNRKALLNDLNEALPLENGFKITQAYTLSPGLYDDGFIALQKVKSNLDNGEPAVVDDALKNIIINFINEINKLNGGKRQSRSRQSRSRQSRSRQSRSRQSRQSRSRQSRSRQSRSRQSRSRQSRSRQSRTRKSQRRA